MSCLHFFVMHIISLTYTSTWINFFLLDSPKNASHMMTYLYEFYAV